MQACFNLYLNQHLAGDIFSGYFTQFYNNPDTAIDFATRIPYSPQHLHIRYTHIAPHARYKAHSRFPQNEAGASKQPAPADAASSRQQGKHLSQQQANNHNPLSAIPELWNDMVRGCVTLMMMKKAMGEVVASIKEKMSLPQCFLKQCGLTKCIPKNTLHS